MANDSSEARVDELVIGVVGDLRDLIGAHGEAIRKDVSSSVGELKQLLLTIAVAMVCALVGAVMVALALSATLVRLGLETWAAMWIVTGAIAVITAVTYVRARRQAKNADVVPDESIGRVGEDAKWVAERAADVVTESDPSTPQPSDDPGVPHDVLSDRKPREHRDPAH